MGVKAIYENDVLKLLEKLNLREGEVVYIEIKRDAVDRLGGLVRIPRKDWKMNWWKARNWSRSDAG
jgi:predicted DNA-binding antitoxin AbrB/MazE fold protein